MKYIEISGQGYVWHIRADAIASHRAFYYAEKDGGPDTWQKEYDYAIGDHYELLDWYINNMDWSDITASDKELVKTPPPVTSPDDVDWQDSGDIKVVEK